MFFLMGEGSDFGMNRSDGRGGYNGKGSESKKTFWVITIQTFWVITIQSLC